MAPEMIKKALGFSVKVEGVLRLCKMSKKHWSQSILEHRKKLIKIPYKTCRILIILEPKTQNGPEMIKKGIRFFSKSGRRFTTVQYVEKALVLEHFGASKKVDQNTLQNLSFMKTFRIKNAFWRSKVSKKHQVFH